MSELAKDATEDMPQPHASPALGGQGRRRFKRTATIMAGKLLCSGNAVEGVVLDVSVNGVRIQAGDLVELRTPVTLVLAGSVHFGGQVVWRHGSVLGIRFSEQPEKVAEIMAALLPKDSLVFGHA